MAFIKFPWSGQKEKDTGSSKATRRSRVAAQAESVEVMRRRARHRLIGAAVLVVVGVAGFALLFDSKPRPVPVNVPISVPDRNNVAPLVVPGSGTSAGQGASSAHDSGLADGEEIVTTPAPRATPAPLPPPAVVPPPAPTPKPVVQPKPEVKPEVKPERKLEPKPEP